MGQKVSPIGLRLGINKTWSSRWFEDSRSYADSLHEDLSIRRYIMNYYYKTLKEEHKKIGGKKDAFVLRDSILFAGACFVACLPIE